MPGPLPDPPPPEAGEGDQPPTSELRPVSSGRDSQPDRPLTWKGWLALGLCVLAANAALVHEYVLRGAMPATVAGPRFQDRFERAAIGEDYFTTGGHWRIARGELWAPETKNNPLWLKMRLPRDVAIEFTARSETASGDRAGDIKFEVFGNGRDHASGYVCIFGGWGNTLSVVARLDEHGKDRKERRDRKVEAGRTYRMRVERQGALLRWYVDGELFLSYDDPRPLAGEGHDRFGFSSWAADLFFDDLTIEPL
ncbi:MAG TPA: hypothetical protein VFP65_24725 [Anaeromyxobacteraceae bacterium]|nr:hypothetical protein [Anaeromyxobacteraceae bacterium]